MILSGPRREQRLYDEARKNISKVAIQLDDTRRIALKMIDSVESYFSSLAHTEPLQPIFERMQLNAAQGHWSDEWVTYINSEQVTSRHHLMKQGRKWQSLHIEMTDLARQMTHMAKELFQLLIKLTNSASNVVSFRQLKPASQELAKDILNKAMALSKLLANQWQVSE